MSAPVLQIPLSSSMREFLEDVVTAGESSSPEDYVQSLIRDAQKRRAKARLEEMLLEGINSGPPIPMNDAFWDDEVKLLRERLDATSEASTNGAEP